jgi:DNA-binding response OmpR family regulator
MKKIMIVDDETDQVYFIIKGFEKKYGDKYEIIPAYGGQECLDNLKKQIPDLIILDLMMPEINGWDVIEKLRENSQWRNIPIIILTARSDRFARHAGEALACDFIEKPINIDELVNRIEHILESVNNK